MARALDVLVRMNPGLSRFHVAWQAGVCAAVVVALGTVHADEVEFWQGDNAAGTCGCVTPAPTTRGAEACCGPSHQPQGKIFRS
ncbi:hypothetical protein LWC34_12335 [Kibdelosporangium philippinense]|uniref:Uncharacterized protein n=1 Tax=Kibdelosporangium philippinense TaxID=211113 RepID=A0ABS8Z6V0_9PSEU|nr:hypothetical protein [Kibdelosporangium philippinense]MCE7003608.1 hypothetical protein [Kibdelosporangium philippinense]